MQGFCVDPELTSSILELSEDELRAFAEFHEDLTTDEQIELYIFTRCILATRSRSEADAQLAIQYAEGWADGLSENVPEGARRRRILDNVASVVCQIRDTASRPTQPRLTPSQSALLDRILAEGDKEAIMDEIAKDPNMLKSLSEILEGTLATLPSGYSHDPVVLAGIASGHGVKYEQDKTLDNLNRLVEAAEKALAAAPPGHAHRSNALQIYASAMFSKSEQSATLVDIDHAIKTLTTALKATYSEEIRLNLIEWLSKAYWNRFKQTKALEDSNKAIENCHMALAGTGVDHRDHIGRLNNLIIFLVDRAEYTKELDAINEAIKYTERWLGLANDDDNEQRLLRLYTLSIMLGFRNKQNDTIDDINRAVEYAELVSAATPLEDSQYVLRLCHLVELLRNRSRHIGFTSDINRAIELAEKGVEDVPPGEPERGRLLHDLASSLSSRYSRSDTGDISDLNRAIDVDENALQIKPLPDRTRATISAGLASSLTYRFNKTEAIEDLDYAIELSEVAVSYFECADYPDLAAQINFAERLSSRYKRTKNLKDLDAAIGTLERASAKAFHGSERGACLGNLGAALNQRFDCLRKPEDLWRAIEVTEQAVDMISPNNPQRVYNLSNLAMCLSRRADQPGADPDDINKAIEMGELALTFPATDGRLQAEVLANLGGMYEKRFEGSGKGVCNLEDRKRAISLYTEGFKCQNSKILTRIHTGGRAVRLLVESAQWKEASEILKRSVELLAMASSLSLGNEDKQYVIRQCAGLAVSAAATLLTAGEDAGEDAEKVAANALRFLEQGRGVIAGLLLEIRTDISALRQQHPLLAAEFVSLRNELDKPSPNPGMMLSSPANAVPQPENKKAKRRHDTEASFTKVCEHIRSKPGFENFLLPPTAEELMNAADQGPVVVVNVSPWRCDAFLVEHHRIRSIKLLGLFGGEALQRRENFSHSTISETLQWLWDVMACPVLEALGIQSPPSDGVWPRIWWVPTGPMATLPLHAAGYHAPDSTNTVLDRAMSSYSTSIKSIIYGRRRSIPKPLGTEKDQALLVAMHNTPGLALSSNLPFAQEEVREVAKLCHELSLEPITPPKRKEECSKLLRTCKMFHFAGHGKLDQLEPSQSTLLLEDWEKSPLTMAQLRDSRLQENAPFLAYLSACSTGTSLDSRLFDECIHLVSGFQLAGFRHVIGTLWEVSDSHCVDVAKIFYKTICEHSMTDFAICRGLHQAILALRGFQIGMQSKLRNAEYVSDEVNLQGENPMYWAPYVHFGV
ncbi:CHAT domain-containing protein [Leptodontidium sp. MPI-SDFR-AT-0119]|nr:CHAT domain-containing protein [Leptodontidium sp. MPI-SDFR-AT-0119]